jgi:ribonuclease VapC
MVVDASAVIAIALNEADAGRLATAIFRSTRRLIAMPTVLEITLVVGGRTGVAGRQVLGRLLGSLDLTAVAFDADHLALAEEAWWQFGKGRHPARLNFGDCFSYALAKIEDEPLLFKGNDFRLTDIRPAPY